MTLLLLVGCLWIPAGDPLPADPDDTDVAGDSDPVVETDRPDSDAPETDRPADSDDSDPPVEATWRALLIVRHLGHGTRLEASLQVDGRVTEPWWRWYTPGAGACAASFQWAPTWLGDADVGVTLRGLAGDHALPWGDVGPHRAELAEVAARATVGVVTTAWGEEGPGALDLPTMLQIGPPGSFQITSGDPALGDLIVGREDLTVSWTPGGKEHVLVRFAGQSPPYGIIRCMVPDADGQVIVPASLFAGWDAGQTVEMYVARGGPATVGDVVDGVLPVAVEMEWEQGFVHTPP